jgi:hypothetical protein
MNKLILLTAFLSLISHKSYSESLYISNNTHKNDAFYTVIITKTCELLDIDNIYISINSKNAYKHSWDENKLASAEMTGKDSFIIYIDDSKPSNSLIVSIIHELVHVEQLYTGRLIIIDDWNIWFIGKKYTVNVPYDERPWEREAFEVSKKLFSEIKNPVDLSQANRVTTTN